MSLHGIVSYNAHLNVYVMDLTELFHYSDEKVLKYKKIDIINSMYLDMFAEDKYIKS